MTSPEQFNPDMRDKKIISLSDIIDPNLAIPDEYQRLIQKQEQRHVGRPSSEAGRFFPTPFSKKWKKVAHRLESPPPDALSLEEAKKGIDFFRTRLSENVLVDLGGGAGTMKGPSRVWEVGTYVNVDRGVYGKLVNENSPSDATTAVADKVEAGLHINGVNADILEFVTKMRNGVGNFTINGIDHYIVDDPKYNQALAQEIVRAMKTGGLVFGVESDIFQYFQTMASADKSPIRKIDVARELDYPEEMLDLNIFEKIE